jgi:ferredoxin
MACRDRKDFWHTLQELAGIHNHHVALAVAQTRAELEAQVLAERNQLASDHAAALALARREAAQDAMQRLTETILNFDLSGNRLPMEPVASSLPDLEAPLAGSSLDEPPRADQQIQVVPATALVTTPATAVIESFVEPWIDSVLCTSCNDCVSRNPRLFVYNDDKQATLGDPQAGSYAELVEAAEACPARCIHPGNPRNPDEPNLDELVARAAPLNAC